MPKKLAPPAATAPIISLRPPPPPSPLVRRLRLDWRWAGISQFLWTFSDAFGFIDWDIESLENDLDGDETQLVPDLIAKLLYALTYNRQINRDNAMENLRKQYLKRAPERTLLGSLEEPVKWDTLGLGQKVGILWELCEWQMNDPARFRALLKSEEESAQWRIDPIGWDKAGNTYFLFDDNRLWIQRLPPTPPRPSKKSSLKAKQALVRTRPSNSQSKRSHQKKVPPRDAKSPPRSEAEEPVSGPRKRTQVAFYGNPTSTVQALKRGGNVETPPSTRGTRSSGRINGEAGPSLLTPEVVTPSKVGKGAPVPVGTRVSRRLRDVEDEWQQVPTEWLNEHEGQDSIKSEADGAREQTSRKGKRRLEEVDDGSELSELTDEEEPQAKLRSSESRLCSQALVAAGDEVEDSAEKAEPGEGVDNDDESLTPLPSAEEGVVSEPNGHRSTSSDVDEYVGDQEKADGDQEIEADDVADIEDPELEVEEEVDEVQLAATEANNIPEGFVEWEAVCVTLYDWRTFPEQFAKSRDPDEKALYTLLTKHVGPTVIEALVVKEQERLKQEAIVNRKRSSRIATMELEKEEIMRREKAQREMEDRMERSRREETRQVRGEVELVSQERAREDRLKEREERAAARQEAAANKIFAEAEAKETALRDREARKRRRELGLDETDSEAGSGTNTPRIAVGGNGVGDRWELACEVCRKSGWNIDEDQDIVCCDDCGKWQHVECHNRLDAHEGRSKRNWDKVDFKCKECRRRAAGKRQRLDSATKPFQHPDPNGTGHAHPTQNGISPNRPPPPPPPPLQPGQYYLPYPPAGSNAPPAGYAMYYPSPQTSSSSGHPPPPSPAGPVQLVQPSPRKTGSIPSPASQAAQHPRAYPSHGGPVALAGSIPHTVSHPFGSVPGSGIGPRPPYANGHSMPVGPGQGSGPMRSAPIQNIQPVPDGHARPGQVHSGPGVVHGQHSQPLPPRSTHQNGPLTSPRPAQAMPGYGPSHPTFPPHMSPGQGTHARYPPRPFSHHSPTSNQSSIPPRPNHLPPPGYPAQQPPSYRPQYVPHPGQTGR